MKWQVFAAGVFLLLLDGTRGNFEPNCDGKQVIVHLFEWKWTSIAEECERFLGPAGFCGVQVSPPQEHVIMTTTAMRPWWERYQPVSYKLTSRSGTEEEFVDMVERCNAVGVRIYVDAILNHMAGLGNSGIGSAGSEFDADAHYFPGVPFSAEDFTPRDLCPSADGIVDDYSDEVNVRNCYLYGLVDLYGASESVREKLAEYLNHLLEIGVDGFRLDASRHMWPEDLEDILDELEYPAFHYLEVIDMSDGAVTVDEYFDLGRVTEFRYCSKIARGIRDFSQLEDLIDLDSGMCPSDKAFVFVDNQDNQREPGAEAISHKEPFLYKMAVSYMLAHPYGFTRIMSSYDFQEFSDPPPHDEDYNTLDVPINPDGSCGNGWVCEHRWPVITRMVEFRNAVVGTDLENFFLEGDDVAFSRGDKGFFAISKSGSMDRVFQTGMPEGTYCNVIDGCETEVTVESDGTARIQITNPEEPILAICQGCTGDGFPRMQ